MQAITTRKLPATNKRPARVKAFASAGSLIVEWDHSLDLVGNHKRAAAEFIGRYKWLRVWSYGQISNGDFVFTCVASDCILNLSEEYSY